MLTDSIAPLCWRLLLPQRAYTPGVGNTVRLFEAGPVGAAADIQHCSALSSSGSCAFTAAIAIPKRFLYDMQTAATTQGVALDNYEAIALGPLLPDGTGRRLLLMVNDDNFNAHQIGTQFVAFALSFAAGANATAATTGSGCTGAFPYI